MKFNCLPLPRPGIVTTRWRDTVQGDVFAQTETLFDSECDTRIDGSAQRDVTIEERSRAVFAIRDRRRRAGCGMLMPDVEPTASRTVISGYWSVLTRHRDLRRSRVETGHYDLCERKSVPRA